MRTCLVLVYFAIRLGVHGESSKFLHGHAVVLVAKSCDYQPDCL